MVQSAQDHKLSCRFTVQQDNDPKHTVKATQEWLWNNAGNVPIQPKWERICRERLQKIPKSMCADLVGSNLRRLIGCNHDQRCFNLGCNVKIVTVSECTPYSMGGLQSLMLFSNQPENPRRSFKCVHGIEVKEQLSVRLCVTTQTCVAKQWDEKGKCDVIVTCGRQKELNFQYSSWTQPITCWAVVCNGSGAFRGWILSKTTLLELHYLHSLPLDAHKHVHKRVPTHSKAQIPQQWWPWCLKIKEICPQCDPLHQVNSANTELPLTS